MQKRRKDYHPYIDSYMDDIRSGKVKACKEIKQAMDLVERKLCDDDVFIDGEKIDKAVELVERYFEITLFPWELFCFAVIHCYYKSDDTVVFKEIMVMMGRGNGKNGFISPLIWYLTTHYHGVKEYNVDIVANCEKQAKTSFEDVYNVLCDTWKKSKKFFYKSKVIIRNLKTRSYIQYNTSNAHSKDGSRTGCIVFDEIHEYESWDTIGVFRSAFGKIHHARIFYITTNGYVRGGVLDEQLDLAHRVLNGEAENIRFLPLIYKLDKKEEYKNPDNWVKANPSLPYLNELRIEMEQNFVEMDYQQKVALDFFTKRMNIPAQDAYAVVAEWPQILATNQPIPYEKIKGAKCIGAVDYAQINDFASVGLLFKCEGKRILLEHTFVCHKALEAESRKINFPVEEMVERGLITIIQDDVIKGDVIADWFVEMSKTYHIIDIVSDLFRKSVLESAFTERGLPLSTVRSGPITHAMLAPLIETMFAEKNLVVGENPTMRWYINNTYQEVDKKGNITYKKIEPKTRKTDGFFMLLHALSKDGDLEETQTELMFFDVKCY